VSGDGQLQLQKAVVTALAAAVSPAKVLDHVPQDTPFPYYALGGFEAREWDTSTELGQEHVFQVHYFERDPKRGQRAVKEAQKKIYDALHDQPLTLEAGAALVLILCEFSTVNLDPDNSYHGVSQFRAITTEA
jgi:hypothetical protein